MEDLTKSNIQVIIEALKLYGLHDIPGKDSNPVIVDFFHKLGYTWINDDETAWCSAFLSYIFSLCALPYSKKLNARSWLDLGIAIQNPKPGDVVVFWRIDKNGPYGHVGIFIKEDSDSVYVLGGNQSNTVDIELYSKAKVLGYRHIS